MQKLNRYFFKLLFLCVVATSVSCRSTFVTEPFTEDKVPQKPDYQNSANWAVLPSKYTEKLKAIAPHTDLEADVFYVYPTLITNKKDIRWNIAVDDAVQNDIILNKAVHFQASAWATSGTIYVPYYRQAHIRSYRMLENGGRAALMLAYSDVKAAFKVYLEKYNKGRPIIIASHSQGTTHTTLLLKEFFDGKPLQKQLVAAYLIGIGTKKDEFKTIKVMTTPDETGGFVSWNTYKKNKLHKKYESRYKGKVTSNPITWDSSKTTSRTDHKGFLYRNDKIYDKALKVEVIDGMLWTTLPRFPLRVFIMFMKNYHVGDVNLFWKDIQENAELRTQRWLKKQEN